jgi:hypothetical protein
MRRRAQLCVADSRRRRPPRPPQERVFQRNTSTPDIPADLALVRIPTVLDVLDWVLDEGDDAKVKRLDTLIRDAVERLALPEAV